MAKICSGFGRSVGSLISADDTLTQTGSPRGMSCKRRPGGRNRSAAVAVLADSEGHGIGLNANEVDPAVWFGAGCAASIIVACSAMGDGKLAKLGPIEAATNQEEDFVVVVEAAGQGVHIAGVIEMRYWR